MSDTHQLESRRRALESQAAASPTLYSLRVALLGVLGHGFLVVVIAVVCVLLLLLIVGGCEANAPAWMLKFLWPILVVPFIVLRAMWVRIPKPVGLEIRRTEAERLHAMLEDVRRQLRAPRVHKVILGYDFNAAIVQVPRLGIWGLPRNYLRLGLPLMMALPPDVFRAVVAHEYGHLSGSHGMFGAWIYSLREAWEQVLIGLEEQQSKLDFGLRSFFNWYVPYFDLYSFVLARAQEYVADRCAAEVTSRDMACMALVEIAVRGSHVHGVLFPALFERASSEARPPEDAFRQMRQALACGPEAGERKESLALSLREQTGYTDTHPSLFDRLSALQAERVADLQTLEAQYRPPPGPLVTSAAEHFLGDDLDRILEVIDGEWCEVVWDEWKGLHRAMKIERAELSSLDEAAAGRELTREQSWARIQGTLKLRGRDHCLAILRPFIRSNPDNARARFLLGQLLLSSGDEGGIAEIEEAMRIDAESVLPGCELIGTYFAARSRDAEGEHWREKARRFLQAVDLAKEERKGICAEDPLAPHGLSEGELRSLAGLFDCLPLRRVLLALKVQERIPTLPVWVLGFSVWPQSGLLRSRDLEASVLQHLQVSLGPLGFFIFFVIEDNEGIAASLERIEGAVVYVNHMRPPSHE